MAATNKKCFDKGCICASCESMCSRCLVSNNACEHGVKACAHKVFKSYDNFLEENKGTGVDRLISRSDYFSTYN